MGIHELKLDYLGLKVFIIGIFFSWIIFKVKTRLFRVESYLTICLKQIYFIKLKLDYLGLKASNTSS